MTTFQAPEGTVSVSVGGEQYKVDENGQITVPDGQAALLLPHGFTPVPPARPARPAAVAETPPAPAKATRKADPDKAPE